MFNTLVRRNNLKRALVITTVAVTAALLVGGCVTPNRTTNGIIVDADDNITITVNYLSRKDLDDRYSERYLPFVAPPMLLTPTEFLVFDLMIETTEAGAIIDTSEIELDFGDKTRVAMTPVQLERFWETNHAYESITGANRVRFLRLINREMITRPPSEKNGVAGGITVFSGRSFPAEGVARIYVPVTSLATGRTTRHRVMFTFEEIERR